MKIEQGSAPPVGADVMHYNRGYAWGEEALTRYTNEECRGLLTRYGHPANSYEAGVFDAIDRKKNRYES